LGSRCDFGLAPISFSIHHASFDAGKPSRAAKAVFESPLARHAATTAAPGAAFHRSLVLFFDMLRA
jgi:hypothetical protein